MMRIVRPSALVLILTIAGLLGSACQSEPQVQITPDVSTPAAPVASGATAIATGPRQIPTPSPDKAVVHGVVREVDTKKPLSEDQGVDLFLAQVIHSADGLSMSSLDKITAPRSDPDKDGLFVFADVAPGEYAIVVRTPLNEIVGRSPNDLNKDIVITVTAGQTLDLGEVYTKFP
jgi:hypothetical protein